MRGRPAARAAKDLRQLRTAPLAFRGMTEQLLRDHVRRSWHPFALVMKRRGGGIYYPPAVLPEALRGYPAPPGQCFAVAVALSREVGLGLRLGFALPEGESRPRVHCFGLDSQGSVIDAAWQRRRAVGYLGFEPSEAELAVLVEANAPEIEALLTVPKPIAAGVKTYGAESC